VYLELLLQMSRLHRCLFVLTNQIFQLFLSLRGVDTFLSEISLSLKYISLHTVYEIIVIRTIKIQVN